MQQKAIPVSSSSSKLTVADTIPKSFLLAVERRRNLTAIREKDHGIWRTVTWAQWLEKSKEIAYALHADGFKPGDVVSILGSFDFVMGERPMAWPHRRRPGVDLLRSQRSSVAFSHHKIN